MARTVPFLRQDRQGLGLSAAAVAVVPHSTPVRRLGAVAAALGAAALVGACGSVRTELPAGLGPAPPLQPAPSDTRAPSPSTTASAYKSPGEKHPLPGGTLAASYPRLGVRPPRGVAPPPPEQVWAVHNVRFCAEAGAPIAGTLVDPRRFQVEVPGQGLVSPAPDAPALAPAPLVPLTAVAPGTCIEGSISYLVGGERHIESIIYDNGAGLLRWAT